ncbi:hypothetical protein ACFW04_013324 [Cataglyphis niger]
MPLEELCAAMNVPCMSEPTYIKYRENLVDNFQKTAMENGWRTDGSWMKRLYGNAYDSLSGIGAIIGYRTGKTLFVSIRNKFCPLCNVAELKSIESRAHKCYKNFDHNASSTRIKSDAIAENFKCSLEMHGLIYKTITDGDSSVYQAIINNKPYHEHTVKKIECTNHLLRTNEKQPQHYQTMELQKGILNIPSHIFGEHKQCETRGYIRTENCNKTKKNYVPFLKLHDLYSKIENTIMYLSGYSKSLLLNLTNNPAESFNSIICKQIGGKRINFGKKGSYNARIRNCSFHYRKSGKTTPNKSCKNQKISRSAGKAKKFKRESGTDYYGPQSQKLDLPFDIFEQLQQNHLEKREMLMASNFGTVCRMRPITFCASTVKNILYPLSIDTTTMKYGRDKKGVARKELAIKLNKEIKLYGLFIDNKNPFLGADRIIEKNALVEIKPYLIKKIHKMNQNHRYFYQVQDQLNITKRKYCIFAVWAPKSIKILHISIDNEFWKNQMLPFLTRFYYECMLPEILNSRHNRQMPIRDPKYIIEAKEKTAK